MAKGCQAIDQQMQIRGTRVIHLQLSFAISVGLVQSTAMVSEGEGEEGLGRFQSLESLNIRRVNVATSLSTGTIVALGQSNSV